MWICKCNVGFFDEIIFLFPNASAVCLMLYICICKFTNLYRTRFGSVIAFIQN